MLEREADALASAGDQGAEGFCRHEFSDASRHRRSMARSCLKRRAHAFGDTACVVNLSAGPVQLPPGTVLITSGPLDGDRLPVDTAAWIQLDNQQTDTEQ